ncbi:hypothetical protein AB4082_21675 [Vibrio cyclitrophicus]
MSKPKLENSLYYHTRSLLNGILPLEYTIRAFKENACEAFGELVSINNEMYEFWLSNGFLTEEIEHERLLDLSWDIIQVGLPLSRLHGRFHHNEQFVKDIKRTAAKLKNKYCCLFLENDYPFTDRYRVADLVSGNDIKDLTLKVIKSSTHIQSYEKEDNIPLSHFPLGKFREAINIYPGSLYQYGDYKIHDKDHFGAGILLDFKMELEDVDNSIREFIYQYAKLREQLVNDSVSTELISRFLMNELVNSNSSNEVKRLDSILTGLLGLYCYDQVQSNKTFPKRTEERTKPLIKAIDKTIELFPNSAQGIGKSESIKKNYQQVKKKISGEWSAYNKQFNKD